MPFIKIFEALLPVVLTIILGFVFGRFKKVDIKSVTDILLYVAIPCLVLSSLLRNPLNMADFARIGTGAAFVVLGGGAVTLLIVKLFRFEAMPGIFMGSMFINSGILAFPIALSSFGVEGLAKAVVYDATNSIFIFSLGIFILVGRKNISQIFRLPVLYSIFAAIAFNAAGINFSGPILNTLSMIGDASIPILLLVLGYQLNHMRPKILHLSFFSGALRLGAGLLLSIAFTKLFGITDLTRSIIILSSSMPTALNSLVLSEEYKVDADLVASTVVMTTLLSFITIPLILHYVI